MESPQHITGGLFNGFVLPLNMDTHHLFLYLGIAIFLMHFVINGVGMDISLFGLLLIIIGWRRIEMYTWVVVLLWIFIVLEIMGDIYHLRRMFDKQFGKEPMPIDSTSTSTGIKYDDEDENNGETDYTEADSDSDSDSDS